MKIKTQFILSAIVLAAILLACVVTYSISNQRLQQISEQEDTAKSIQQDANELAFLTNSYLLFRDNSQATLWQSKIESVSSSLANLQVSTLQQQTLIDDMKTNQQRLLAVFTEIKSSMENNPTTTRNLDYAGTAYSRLAVQNQAVIANANQLAALLRKQSDQIKQHSSLLIFVLFAVFGIVIVANFALISRRVVNGLSKLASGARIIGSGNLNHVVPVKGRKDEISDVSLAFNQMTSDLRSVTASKADLENEIEMRKKTEEALKLSAAELEVVNKELETFSYSVSHDLRSPLRTLEGFSEMLIQEYGDKLSETGQDYLNRIRKASQTMSQLIDDILKLSRITRAEVHKETFDLNAIVEPIAAELRLTQPDRKAEFIVVPEINVNGDRPLLQILLRNLMENSWKYTSKCPQTRIEVGANRQNGKMVYFIKDNGIGFDMKQADKLFQPFQRLHTSKDYPGTGIGLATAQRVIHRHGGKIWAESEMGKGSTFYFTLD